MDLNKEKKLHKNLLKDSRSYSLNFSKSLANVYKTPISNRKKIKTSKKIFIATLGFTHSGKTYIAKKLIKKFPQLVKIESREIHNTINSIFPELKDDKSVEGEAYWLRQVITQDLREKLIEKLCQNDWWIINDSANLVKEERQKRLKIAKKFKYKTVLVWVMAENKTLVRRIKKSDAKLKAKGEKQVWMNLYKNVQHARFEKPTRKEADLLIKFRSQEDGLEKKVIKPLQQLAKP
jgi:predicted kinase